MMFGLLVGDAVGAAFFVLVHVVDILREDVDALSCGFRVGRIVD